MDFFSNSATYDKIIAILKIVLNFHVDKLDYLAIFYHKCIAYDFIR